jgi:hypothetical protein
MPKTSPWHTMNVLKEVQSPAIHCPKLHASIPVMFSSVLTVLYGMQCLPMSIGTLWPKRVVKTLAKGAHSKATATERLPTTEYMSGVVFAKVDCASKCDR